MEGITALVGKINAVLVNPILALIFGAGLLVFVWGLVQYLYELNVKGESNSEAKMHMLWGIIGMFIMLAAFTIIKIISNTIGVQLPAGY